jgi:hypothetical protein
LQKPAQKQKMQSLAIVVCGQLRTFFEPDVQASFTAFLRRCAAKYYVVVFFMLNETAVDDRLAAVAAAAAAADVVVEPCAAHMPSWLTAFRAQIDASAITPHIMKACAAIPQILLEVQDPMHFLTVGAAPYAFLLFKHGLQRVREYEAVHHIRFDVIVRTRADVLYPPDLLPFGGGADAMFPHSLTQRRLYEQRCALYGLDPSGYHMERFGLPPSLRIPDALFGLNLGGAYYNRRAAAAAADAPHLYGWNDHIIAGRRDSMMKFESFFDIFDNPALLTIAKERCIQFLIAQEALLLLFAFVNGLDMYMYLDNSWSLRRPSAATSR